MSEPGALFPADWLQRTGSDVGTDLDLAVLLVNSLDLLADPADRLADLEWLDGVFTAVGHRALAEQLDDRDLPGLRDLRDDLRLVFEAPDDGSASELLNPLLLAGGAVPVLVVGDDGAVELTVAPDRTGLSALQARLPAAVATFVAERGVRRLGTCDAGPCSCAYVDRTRGGTRRYCCSYCNDRAAARSYRARARGRQTGD